MRNHFSKSCSIKKKIISIVQLFTTNRLFRLVKQLFLQIIEVILNSGREYAAVGRSGSPLMYQWHEKEYLGGAHGLAGILYILLQV